MDSEAIIRPGAQRRALWMSTIAFTVCFAVWTIFAIIGIRIKQEKVRISNGTIVVALALALGLVAIIAATWGSQTIFSVHPYVSTIAPLNISSGALSAPQPTSPSTLLG